MYVVSMIGMSREIYFVYLIASTNKHLKCLFLLLEGKIWFFTHILIRATMQLREKKGNRDEQFPLIPSKIYCYAHACGNQFPLLPSSLRVKMDLAVNYGSCYIPKN